VSTVALCCFQRKGETGQGVAGNFQPHLDQGGDGANSAAKVLGSGRGQALEATCLTIEGLAD